MPAKLFTQLCDFMLKFPSQIQEKICAFILAAYMTGDRDAVNAVKMLAASIRIEDNSPIIEINGHKCKKEETMTNEINDEELKKILVKLLPEWLHKQLNIFLSQLSPKDSRIKFFTFTLAIYMAGYKDAAKAAKENKK